MPEKPKVQLSLKALFGGTRGVLVPTLKKGKGRPSAVSKSLEATMKASAEMVSVSVRQFKEATETLHEDKVQKLKANMQREVTAEAKRNPLALVEARLGFK